MNFPFKVNIFERSPLLCGYILDVAEVLNAALSLLGSDLGPCKSVHVEAEIFKQLQGFFNGNKNKPTTNQNKLEQHAERRRLTVRLLT